MATEPSRPEARVLVVHSDPADLAVLASVVAGHVLAYRLRSFARLRRAWMRALTGG